MMKARKLVMGIAAILFIGVAVLAWLYYALTQPTVWIDEVGGGWKLEQKRYAMSHGTSFGVLFRDDGAQRLEVDQLVYVARWFPQVSCVVYGTTKQDVRILAVCDGRRATVVRNAGDGWTIGEAGVSKGVQTITPAQILALTRRSP